MSAEGGGEDLRRTLFFAGENCYNERHNGSGNDYSCGGRKKERRENMKRKERGSCETCAFYVYDDEYGAYLSDLNMDEYDYVRIMSDRYYQCPYYRNGDEYAVVRKQI